MADQEAAYWQILKLMEEGTFSEAAPRMAVLVAGSADARFHATFGICLQELGRWSEAIQHYETALALKPSYCEADWRTMLAEAYLRDGQKSRAIAQWRIVAAMTPAYPNYDIPIKDAQQKLEKPD